MTTISSAPEEAPVAAPLVGRPDVNRKRMARLGWMFTAPALIIVGLITIFPIVYSVVISLSNATVSGNGISLNGFTTANYSLVLKNSTWHYALAFTIIYTLITVVVELVFAWPGMGQLFLQSIQNADIPIMAAYLLMIATLFVVINLIVDLIYVAVDPRLRTHLHRAQG